MNKKIIIAVATLATVFACNNNKNYVTISGKIANKNSNSLTISDAETGYKKVISVDEKGVFKDTLNVKTGFYTLFDGAEYAALFLQNGDDISVTLDTKEFDETIKFTGKGSEESNFLAKSNLNQEAFFMDKNTFNVSKGEFDTKVKSYVDEFTGRLKETEASCDSSFVNLQHKTIQEFKTFAEKMYAEKQYIKNSLSKGKPSPKFTDYENIKGGKTSLDDLKGKYLYIDVWATWCKPCKDEIPALKQLADQFKGENIEFVSISVDDKRDYETWKAMVADKQMTGVQLYSNRDMKFLNEYKIASIPRFILLDPEGNIVDAQASRPSEPQTVDLLNSLVK